MEVDKKKEHGKYILDITREWISNVDVKISILLAFVGIIFGYIFIESDSEIFIKVINSINNRNITSLKLIKGSMIVLTHISSLITILSLLNALRAKINIKKFKENGITINSIIFYGNIASMNYNEYKKKVDNQTDESFINDIYSQAYITSMICTKKFKYYNIGIYMTIVSLSLLITSKVTGVL